MDATRADRQVTVIDRFDGHFDWLANQSSHRSGYGGHFYRTVEHAYAAAKSDNDDDRSEIAALPTQEGAYQAGRRVPLRADWDKRIRFEAMWAALPEKFADLEATDAKTVAPKPATAAKPGAASSTQVNFRADEATRKDLDFLTADGTPVSEAIRSALRLAVWRKRENQMVIDAEAAMADPADVAEIARLAADLDSISAW